MSVGDIVGSPNSQEEIIKNMKGPVDHKKVLSDVMWEKVRQYIKQLPLHKQIKLHQKIMNNNFNLGE